MPRAIRLTSLALAAALGCAPLYGPPPEVGPASVDPGSLSARAAGCWALTWQLRQPPAEMAQAELPDSVRLEDSPIFVAQGWALTPATHPEGRGLEVGASEATWESRYRTNRWRITGQTVEVVFSGADAFWTVSLLLETDGLRGTGILYEQEGPDDALLEASVVGQRLECPSWVVG